MTIHYHGTPITPASRLDRIAGAHFCVSWFGGESQCRKCHEVGQSVMIDNGAYTSWTVGGLAREDWTLYYEWVDQWLDWPTTWAVIPDQIDGAVSENDSLIKEWPHGKLGAPVWHLNEPIKRLLALCDAWPRVCFGSAGEYRKIGSNKWHERAELAFNEISRRHKRMPWIHMLRGMSLSGTWYPFASVDSTDVARNHHRPENDIRWMVERWDRMQCPGNWAIRKPQQVPLFNENGE